MATKEEIRAAISREHVKLTEIRSHQQIHVSNHPEKKPEDCAECLADLVKIEQTNNRIKSLEKYLSD